MTQGWLAVVLIIFVVWSAMLLVLSWWVARLTNSNALMRHMLGTQAAMPRLVDQAVSDGINAGLIRELSGAATGIIPVVSKLPVRSPGASRPDSWPMFNPSAPREGS